MYSGSDSTWRGLNTNEVPMGILAADEWQRSTMTLPGSMPAAGERAYAARDLGSTQPGNGKGAKGSSSSMKVRPRPPPIRVPGA
jgi:hypothetical protein